MLEGLFGADWFTAPTPKRSRHPAYQHWKFCSELRASGGRLAWRDQGELHTIAAALVRALRDSAAWVQCTQGDIGVFRFGRLADYGDAEVVRRVMAVIQDSRQYDDLLAELICASWHLSHGHTLKPSESPGRADFTIGVPGWSLPIIADCKRLSKGATEGTLKGKVKKANQQIKAVGIDAYGLVLLNLADWLPSTMALDDHVPDAVAQIQRAVAKLLSRYCTAISAAVLIWDEISILGPSPNSPLFVKVALRTKSVVVNHRAPLHPLPMETEAIRIGFTIEYNIRG
jgi:hypothetical protein